jgi:ribosomal protein L7/L12
MSDTIVAWMNGLTLGLIIITFFILAKIGATVARFDRKVDALLRHSGVDLSKLASQEVEALMKAGRKIEAIKAYRELTGASLAEAKAAVERMD